MRSRKSGQSFHKNHCIGLLKAFRKVANLSISRIAFYSKDDFTTNLDYNPGGGLPPSLERLALLDGNRNIDSVLSFLRAIFVDDGERDAVKHNVPYMKVLALSE